MFKNLVISEKEDAGGGETAEEDVIGAGKGGGGMSLGKIAGKGCLVEGGLEMIVMLSHGLL